LLSLASIVPEVGEFIQEWEQYVMCAERIFLFMAYDHMAQSSLTNPFRFAEPDQIKRLAFRH
jgi:hypothetical protein